MVYVKTLFASDSFTKKPQFGMCIVNDPALHEALITFALPAFLTSLITVFL